MYGGMAMRDSPVARVRCYTRVSTEEQALSGYSLAAQREHLQGYVRRMGWDCAGWYVDEGKSAKDLNRPEFQRMMADSRPGDLILVTKLDRLTRSVRDLDELLRTFGKRDLLFQSATEQFETRTPGGRLYMGIVAVIAQWEREIIADRSAAGKKQKVVQGEWSGGPIPFGYVAEPSGKMKAGRELLRLVPDPERAHIVRGIFERYVNGQGMRAVCIWLNDEVRAYTTHGARWRVSTLVRLLTNPIYAGFVTHGRRAGKEVVKVQGSHEALVPEDLFNQAQNMFAIRKGMTPRQATGIYPLAGIAKCGVCGGRIDASHHRKKGFYSYRCTNYVNGVGCGDGTQKPNSGVVGHAVEAWLLGCMEQFAQTEELDRFLRTCAEENERQQSISAAEIRRLRGAAADAERAIRRWERVFENGKIEWDELQAKTREHRERLQAAREQLGQANERPALPSRTELAAYADKIKLAWEHLEPPERKALLQEFVHAFKAEILLFPDRRVTVQRATPA
jgi:site-specific DNA recombinase